MKSWAVMKDTEGAAGGDLAFMINNAHLGVPCSCVRTQNAYQGPANT